MLARLSSTFFFVTGIILFLFGIYFLWQRTTNQSLNFDSSYAVDSHKNTIIYPTEIIIPSLQIDLSIFPSQIMGGNWQTTTKGISYLSSSVLPGDIGNSILYGHNWMNLFGKLPQIKQNAKIEIIFNDKIKKDFVVAYTTIISPNQTAILKNSSNRQITLYTCIGFFDSKRFVVVAYEKDFPRIYF